MCKLCLKKFVIKAIRSSKARSWPKPRTLIEPCAKQLLLMEWIKMDEMYHAESFALMSASCLLFLKMFWGWTASPSSKQCIKSGGTQSFPSPATMILWSEPIEREKIAKIFKLLIFRGSDIMPLSRYSFNNPYFYLSTLWICGGQRVR